MAYRDDLTALAARHDALIQDVDHKTRERVASPCTADWNEMTGDERVRHCGECKKDVYNLSGMTRDQAEALLIQRAGNLCVRYFQRQDGTILLADCTIGAGRSRTRRRVVAAGAAALLAGGAGLAAMHRPRETLGSVAYKAGPDVTMGRMALPDPQVAPPAAAQSPDEDAPELPPPSMRLPEAPATPPSRQATPPRPKMGKLARPDGFWVTGVELPDNPHRGPR
jgi:hypothetical protein